ncbi:unnamed protein product [Adineta ricciae]|uniref:DNA topoisomerase I n=1 Tax=Adineta ricciae TaxID=249248 RepID=A0A813MKP3_ADIRI|nr:unnamed protein product [Adineta ricciae]CAF0774215.1 unnamed protein product [Adineta ricciae]
MMSVANPKLPQSVLSTNANSTKSSPSSTMKKESNNNTKAASNGNSSKSSPVVNKRPPMQSSPIKRKTRILSDSDESDNDNQSLAKKAATLTTTTASNGPSMTNSEPKPALTPTKTDTLQTSIVKKEPTSTTASPAVKKEATTPTIKKESTTPIVKKETTIVIKKEPKTEPSPPKRKSTTIDSDDDDAPLSKKAKSHIAKKAVTSTTPTAVKNEKPSTSKSPSSASTKKSTATVKQEKVTPKKESKPIVNSSPTKGTTTGKRTKKEEEDVWRWWEDEQYTDGRKWTTLEHKGPLFPPPYEPLPSRVKFFYNGAEVKLKPAAEEIMTFYARMLDHDYTSKSIFNENFMNDWRESMTSAEREVIKDIRKCDFTQVANYFKEQTELRKNMSKEEKKQIKEENERIRKEYGFCLWDGHRQPVGNYKIEPPGLFRGRGEHPKMGCLKKRIRPEDVIINIGRTATIPKPPEGHKWKEVRHDNKVTWLVMWTENIRGNHKYIMLSASSRVKGERDWQKYEKARKLHRIIDKIRENYQMDWKSKEMKIRQRAVALYFIDKLALRAGNEKDEDEADTVGCCSLRVEHIRLHDRDERLGDNVVEFDFLGKDSIRYNNRVAVEPRVYKNLKLFIENKEHEDELFDRLTTASLNQYLSELMDGLTAKVFRTYNASKTLQEQLDLLTDRKANVAEKVLAYNRANRQVALLCNHQRSIPKTFEKSMSALKTKIDAKKSEVNELKGELKRAKAEHKNSKSQASQKKVEAAEKKLQRADEALKKLEVQELDRRENAEIALGTSKLNYLDPRISVAWCKKWSVPIEKVYSKTQRDKFRWAIDMATADYHFHNYKGEIVLRNIDESNNNGEGDDEDDVDDDEQNSEDA